MAGNSSIVRVTDLLTTLTKAVDKMENDLKTKIDKLDSKIDKLKDDDMAEVKESIAVHETKISRLEYFFYGMVMLATAQVIALVFMLVKR